MKREHKHASIHLCRDKKGLRFTLCGRRVRDENIAADDLGPSVTCETCRTERMRYPVQSIRDFQTQRADAYRRCCSKTVSVADMDREIAAQDRVRAIIRSAEAVWHLGYSLNHDINNTLATLAKPDQRALRAKLREVRALYRQTRAVSYRAARLYRDLESYSLRVATEVRS